MPKGWEIKKRRREMWKQDPHCYWCRRETVLYHKLGGGKTRPDQATIDHLYNRLDPRRLLHAHGECKYVLSCYECNWKRGLETQRCEQELGNPKAFG